MLYILQIEDEDGALRNFLLPAIDRQDADNYAKTLANELGGKMPAITTPELFFADIGEPLELCTF